MKKISEIQPTIVLREILLENHAVASEIYTDGQRPLTDRPYDFIDVSINGTIKTDSNNTDISRCSIACTIYVQLDNGVTNKLREKIMLESMESIFEGTVEKDGFQFTPDFSNLIANARDFKTGYSIKTININTVII